MRIGIFICHCGHNIKSTVDIDKIKEFFTGSINITSVLDYPFLCSEPGQALIKNSIKNDKLERVVIAACTKSLHQDMFKSLVRNAGLNPFLLRRIGIREHCSWVGDDIEKNTVKAIKLIKAGIYSLAHYESLEEKLVEVNKSVLILGGGISGMSAAIFLARSGMEVYIAEKENELGGHLRHIKEIWPVRKQGREIIDKMKMTLKELKNVNIFTSSRLISFCGSFGNYQATLETPEGEKKITIGGLIVAIGFSPFDPSTKPELQYGIDKRIITTLDFENNMNISFKEGDRVAILHCIGSRDDSIGKTYCSRVCCINAIKTANYIKSQNKNTYVESFYMDVRSHPRGGEEFYEDTQEKGVFFTRANISEIIPEKTGVILRGEDTLLGMPFEREFDLVILSIGLSYPEDGHEIANLLKITLDKDGFFLEAHPKLRPYDTALKGIFIAGSCSGPKDMEESINHGRASAVKLYGLLNLGYTFVEPFIANVDTKRCSGCRVCEQVCVAKAINFDGNLHIVRVEEAACMGCGLCNATCPSSAISLKGYFDSFITDEISGLLEIA